MNELKIFENPKFGSVRTLEEDGKVLFCGSDVAKALGYAIPTKAVNTQLQREFPKGNPHERRRTVTSFYHRRRRLPPYHTQQTSRRGTF